MINVLIVEDSRVVSEYLYYILSRDPRIQVIGNVSNGKLAIEFLKDQKVDVITMDIDMPVMNGLEATRIIMEQHPTPIIIVTASHNANAVNTTMEALSAGALSVIEKPVGFGHKDEEEISTKLINLVKLMADVRVITRKPKVSKPVPARSKPSLSVPDPGELITKKIVAIGVSSGGPVVLQKLFSKISKDFPLPIIVVQHISEGFLQGLIDWLRKTTSVNIKIAADDEKIRPGNIYFAPDKHNIGVTRKGRINLSRCLFKSGICPSVSYLFNSLAIEFGEDTIAMLLTGMGNDGAAELKILRKFGALTIAQDKASSLIYGMPGVAKQLDAAQYILSDNEIGVLLTGIEKNH